MAAQTSKITPSPPEDAFFLTALADRANDIILATDAQPIDAPDGPRIVYCNAAFERQTGWTRAEVMGLTPRILQTHDTDRRELDRIRATLIAWNAGDRDAEVRVRVRNQRRGGALYWSELDILPVWGPNGAGCYFVSLQRDVSAMVEQENALIKAVAAADEARIARELFMAKVGHDMRTPLNAIIGYAELIARDAQEAGGSRHGEYAGTIAKAGHQLNRMVRDLMDLAAMRSGAFQLEIEAMRVREIADTAVAMARPAAENGGVTVRFDGDGSLWALCDGMRTRQCLINLIDNAVRHSPRGGVVRLSARQIEGRVAIAVADEGPGLTAEEIATALSLYGQVGGPKAKKGGLGLGLPITAQLMAAQNGALHVTSTPGAGATFTLDLPAA